MVNKKKLLEYIEETIETADGNGLYYKFKTSMSFRYEACHILYQHGYVVHGSGNEFDTFDKTKIKGGSRSVYGWGAYFTNDSYKCEEYGNNFVFLNIRPFKLLELDDKVNKNDNIITIYKQIDSLNGRIIQADEGMYNARNSRDYDYFSMEKKQCKAKLRELIPDSKTEAFIEMYSYIVKKNPEISYLHLTKKLRDVFQNKMGEEYVSEMFLHFGYDGFHADNQFILFNFDKINDNIVKDKNGLLEQIFK